MANQVKPAKGEVADEVEDFVPRRLVGESQSVFNRPAGTEDEKLIVRQVLANPLRAEGARFFFEQERSTTGDFPGERFRREISCERLASDRGPGTVIENVTGGQPVVRGGRWVQADRCAILCNDNGLRHGPDRPASGLKGGTGGHEGIRKASRGAIQARWLRGIQFDDAVVDSQAGEGGEGMFD